MTSSQAARLTIPGRHAWQVWPRDFQGTAQLQMGTEVAYLSKLQPCGGGDGCTPMAGLMAGLEARSASTAVPNLCQHHVRLQPARQKSHCASVDTAFQQLCVADTCWL